MNIKKQFGERIRQLRKRVGLTQEQIASKVNMDYKYWGAVERGEKNITIDNIEKIATALQIDPYLLFLFADKGVKMKEDISEEKLKEILNSYSGKKAKLANVMEQIISLVEE